MSFLWLLEGIQPAAVQWPWAAKVQQFQVSWKKHVCSFYDSPQWFLTTCTWSISIFLEVISISFSVFLRDSGPWIDMSGVSTVEIWWVVDWRHQRWQCSRNSCVQERFVFLAFNGTEPLQKHTGAVIKGFVIVSLCLLFCSFHQGHLL